MAACPKRARAIAANKTSHLTAREGKGIDMRIIQLTSENVKRVKAVTITPKGDAIVIGGANGNGKSSVLDSIAYALGGKSLIPSVPIRKGQKNARIEVDLGDLIVERRFTEKGSTLQVSSKDGLKYPSPQSVLDALVGTLSFDPLEFVNMKPDKQTETLKALVGVSFDDLDSEAKRVYEERTLVNREAKTLEGQLAGLPSYPDAPAEAVSVDSLLSQIEEAETHNGHITELQGKVHAAEREGQESQAAAKRCEDEIERLRLQAAQLKQDKERHERAAKESTDRAKAIEANLDSMEVRDTSSLKKRIRTANETNQKINDNERRKTVALEMKRKNQESTKLTLALEEIASQKEQRLAEAKFPVEGLSFSEEGVLLNELPFEQASSAEQLKVSLAMGIAMNPKLKVLLIRDGSLLDEDNLRIVTEMAEANDAQIWIERVSKGKECSVIIENGEVAEEAVTV